jgi:hypothetical protein
MAFRKGESGNPQGRPKGSQSKQTKAVAERLEALGCDPIEGMARLAMDETVESSIRAQMYKELAQYVAPKRKAIEHSGPSEGQRPPQIIIDLSGED